MLAQTAHLIEISVNLKKLKFKELGKYSEMLNDFRLPDSGAVSSELSTQLPRLDEEISPYELCNRLQIHCNVLGLNECSDNVRTTERRLKQAEATLKKFQEYLKPDSDRLMTYDGANAEIQRLSDALSSDSRS